MTKKFTISLLLIISIIFLFCFQRKKSTEIEKNNKDSKDIFLELKKPPFVK